MFFLNVGKIIVGQLPGRFYLLAHYYTLTRFLVRFSYSFDDQLSRWAYRDEYKSDSIDREGFVPF